jgi:hypothetical protein
MAAARSWKYTPDRKVIGVSNEREVVGEEVVALGQGVEDERDATLKVMPTPSPAPAARAAGSLRG